MTTETEDKPVDALPLEYDPSLGVLLLSIEKSFDRLSKRERRSILAALRSHRKNRTRKAGTPPLGSEAFEAWLRERYPDTDAHRDEIRELRSLRCRLRFVEEAAETLARRRRRENARRDVISGYLQGRTVKEIVKETGVSQSSVYRLIQQYRVAHGLPKTSRRVRKGDTMLSEAPPSQAPSAAALSIRPEMIVEIAAAIEAAEKMKDAPDGQV